MTSPNYRNSKFQSIANVDSNGSITNMSFVGTSNLGLVSNVIITGGNSGQVLTTDGTGNLSWAEGGGGGGAGPAFSAILSTNLNIGDGGSGATIVWNSEEYDTANAYNTSTGIFTAPVAGYYQFSAVIRMFNATYTSLSMYFVKNGVNKLIVNTSTFGTSLSPGINGCRSYYMAVGDTMQVLVFQASGGARLMEATNSVFQGTFLRAL